VANHVPFAVPATRLDQLVVEDAEELPLKDHLRAEQLRLGALAFFTLVLGALAFFTLVLRALAFFGAASFADFFILGISCLSF
jgi:hypothetical protein